MNFEIINIDRLSGNDLTTELTMRWRLASMPDVDGSYTLVTGSKTIVGITIPFLDTEAMAAGTYVLHSYYTPDGPTTGTKITFTISDEIVV